MKTTSTFTKLGAAALLLVSLTSCEDILEQYFPKPAPPPSNFGLDIPFYALSNGNKLDAYSTHSPTRRSSSAAITGLQAGEKIVAIDFRPATGQLYGLGSTSRIYVINQSTGAARAIGAGPFTPAVAGDLVGFDFNPTVDRIRIVTSTGQNLRVNPETGAGVLVDGSLKGVAGASVSAVAYTNNIAGATATELFALDAVTKKLYKLSAPNEGTLETVADLKINFTGEGGFDIDPKSDSGLGLFQVDGKPTLFTLDVQTGAARTLTTYDPSLGYTGLAIPTQPVAYAVSSTLINFEERTTRPELLIFDPSNLGAGVVLKPITGIPATESVSGLDFRPANGQLYAITRSIFTTSDRLYTINAATGAATAVGSTNFKIVGLVGFDFDPVLDRIRVIGSEELRGGGVNPVLLVNPTDATTTAQPSLTLPQAANNFLTTVGAAHDHNLAGAKATNLYLIDTYRNDLYMQSPAGMGALAKVGNLGVQVVKADFDISSTTNTPYALITLFGARDVTKLHTIDLATGKANAVSNYEFQGNTVGFTVGLGF
ncbi:DUF4394 domain-containing protein [Hymenobacter sp. HDW8]|uniref:DUF4394 domain-containing protein n=1 Tax=Hymenobacter sp. HDW8 TaxID=2714932 RepID=UPI00140A42AC|nr:DUF4394 domain-containing protein [Hymenobacter sp. HDW8]QIL74894.1 DUF4394 domain-containing protein [Hymenobacter sp. HDW8]